MNYDFNLPDLGEGLVEGELVRWHVKVGETVSENQTLAAVLTDKAEVEIPSPKSGTIVTLHGKPGQKVRVHAPLVTLSLTASTPAASASRPAASAPSASSMASAPARVAAPIPAVAASGKIAIEPPATPMVRRMARDMGFDLSEITGTGPEGRVLENDVRNFRRGGATASTGEATSATAAVRRLAGELGVNLSTVQGTGPGRRISELDVRAAAPTKRPGAAASAPSGPAVFTPAGRASEGEERVPFVGIRRKIAEKMAESTRTVAHVTHMDECDMTALLALRDELKPEAGRRGVKLTFLPFVIRALVKALGEFPNFNSTLDEAAGEIIVRKRYNIGIAVAAAQGLVVPNIKGADGRDLWGLASEVAALAEKVRANKIDVPSLQGGTFTITNIGPIGGLFATPIVNHPEAAILGLMKLQKRPVWRDGGIFARDMMNLVLSFDHRIVDGADAAHFMNTLIRHLENPRTLL